MIQLHTPIEKGGRVYTRFASKLQQLGIFTFEDFLYYMPFRYDDFSLISPIDQIQEGEIVTVQGTVLKIQNVFTKSYKKIQKAIIQDATGIIEATWFNQPFLTKYIHTDDRISLSGRVERFGNKLTLGSPEYELLSNETVTKTLHTGRLVPIYSETKGITSKWIRRQVYKLLTEQKETIIDFLPEKIKIANKFPELYNALCEVHFPTSLDRAFQARQRLAFDELFLLQLKSLERKTTWEKTVIAHVFAIDAYQANLQAFLKSLPFILTETQQQAVDEIMRDLTNISPMNRLLQGDVGSGKTVVAAVAMYMTYLNSYQSVLMAPTEILAQQHFQTLETFLAPFGVIVKLVTGSNKLTNEKFDILVGTHAVLSKNVLFDTLGLVVIDEQQRFGVKQRGLIRQKGESPHVLTMTATPIPRTIALTMYGDLALSYLSSLPRGRKPIKTWLVPTEKRTPAYDWIRKEIQMTSSQAFIICPFIEESENMQTVKAASVEYERLRKEVFPDLSLGLLHGKMKSKEKDTILTDFREKKYDILVATPVVEVGIDIPNATIIMIEAADRFGLAQLHQLRGRVGRGEKQSYCLLFTESDNEQTIQRLKAMEIKNNGAELAELDMKLRGPGDIFGTMQHGMPKLKTASFSDISLIEKAKKESLHIFPELETHTKLKEKLDLILEREVLPD